ncbi:MAG: FkbM family methyltransferase [Longimicrobiales bacterium]
MGLIRFTTGALRRARDLSTFMGAREATVFAYFDARGVRRRFAPQIGGHRVVVRSGTPDVDVALASLRGEFQSLPSLVAGDFDGYVLDAGGYIGTAAMCFASFWPKATVVTLEPSRSNFDVLAANVAPYDNIVPLRKALGAADGASGSRTLRDRGTGEWGFTIVDSPDDAADAPGLEAVEVVGLEALQAELGIAHFDIVKLDIEGAERDLMEYDGLLLDRAPIVLVELHERIVAGTEATFKRWSHDRITLLTGGEKWLSIDRALPTPDWPPPNTHSPP